jgi:hypothetical protein
MPVHFIFLIKLYVAAHHNDGLPHQEHEKAPQQRQRQDGKPAIGSPPAKDWP